MILTGVVNPWSLWRVQIAVDYRATGLLPAQSHPVFLRMLSVFRSVLPLAAAIFTVGCARVATTPIAPAPEPLPAPRATASGTAQARADSVQKPYTKDDITFMTGMIGHHAQAITMSELAPARTKTRSIQVLAARIINAQRDEIRTMQQWLIDRGQPLPMGGMAAMGSGGGGGADHAGMHGMSHDLMPGMLSEAQMNELIASKGSEFERLFLTYMIQHHRGAVTMVNELFSHDGAGQDDTVFKFASDVHTDQTTEIARMELMLKALAAGQ